MNATASTGWGGGRGRPYLRGAADLPPVGDVLEKLLDLLHRSTSEFVSSSRRRGSARDDRFRAYLLADAYLSGDLGERPLLDEREIEHSAVLRSETPQLVEIRRIGVDLLRYCGGAQGPVHPGPEQPSP